MVDKSLFDAILLGLDDFNRRQEERDQSEYDGILGMVPDWFPLRDKNRFTEIRNYLLNEYSFEIVSMWLKHWMDDSSAGIEVIERTNPVTGEVLKISKRIPDPRANVPVDVQDSINTLAFFWRCAALGEKNGLKSLDKQFSEMLPDADKGKRETYDKRKESFERWEKTIPDINRVKTKNDIHIGLKVFDPENWNIRFSSFQRDFWQPYTKERSELKRKR